MAEMEKKRNRVKTMSIQGSDYAKVASRVAEAHKWNEKISILTTAESIGESGKLFLLGAKVISDKWEFTWHSLQKIESKKDFEKGETIAVGRALAFAWYLADWEIASYEEMQSYKGDLDELEDKLGNAQAIE